MFVFTSDLVIRQQVSELLNEADNLRNIIQRNTVLFDKVCLQQTSQHFLVLSWFAEFFYLSLIQCYPHRKLQRNRNPFPSRLINGEIICHSNFCICGQNPEWCSYSNTMIFGNETLNFYFYIFFLLWLLSAQPANTDERSDDRKYVCVRRLLLAVKGFTKGAFHLSGLAGRTIARPVNLKIKQTFFKSFCRKTISFVHTIHDLTDLAGEF